MSPSSYIMSIKLHLVLNFCFLIRLYFRHSPIICLWVVCQFSHFDGSTFSIKYPCTILECPMRILANTTSFHRSLKLIYIYIFPFPQHGFYFFKLLFSDPFHCLCHSSCMLSIIERLRSLKGIPSKTSVRSSFAVLLPTSSANSFPNSLICAWTQQFFVLIFESPLYSFSRFSANTSAIYSVSYISLWNLRINTKWK